MKMRLASGNGKLGETLVKMLGLPKHTRGFELRCYVNEVITVKCEYYPEEKGVAQLELILKEYELHEKREEDDAISNNPLT